MRILIADDEVTSRLLLEAIVTRLGHECLVATDGDRAWELLASEKIDVLLTDWMMPGLDGPELCRRARDEGHSRYVYIVLITALGDQEQVLEGMGAGADDYLVKPVDVFAVETRLVAAQRVTSLHRQVADFQEQLEQANAILLGQSLTDPLTGLGNRRHMEQDLARAHERAIRSGRCYGIAMFDIDHFKRYNDHYGHIGGDEAIRRVAHTIETTIRAGEVAYRYGGEEFLLLLPDCDLESVTTAAERVRNAVLDQQIPHISRPDSPSVVTLSAGVSCWTPAAGPSVPDLIRDADEALFEAKSAGRNRVGQAASGRSGVLVAEAVGLAFRAATAG